MSENERRENNKDKVLHFLQERGNQGATNYDLLGVGGFRYGARLFELRNEGWAIRTIDAGKGVFRFILQGRAQIQPSLF